MQVENRSPSLLILSTHQTCSQVFSLTEKIKKFVQSIFRALKEILLFPFRYVGSKTWSLPGLLCRAPFKILSGKPIFEESSYHFNMQKELTPTELRAYLKYGAAVAATYKGEAKWIEGVGNLSFYPLQPDELDRTSLPSGTVIKDCCLWDPEMGLKAALMQNDEEVIIVFGGKGSSIKDLSVDEQRKIQTQQNYASVKNFIGFSPLVYEKASQIVDILKNSPLCQNKKVSLAGQSWGGSLASYVGIKQEIPTVCFNSFPLGVGLQWQLGSKALAKADQYITHISAKNDICSDCPWITTLDRLMNFLSVKTPGNFGKRFRIPSAYSDIVSTHYYILGSMMKHLGYDIRSYPKEAQMS